MNIVVVYVIRKKEKLTNLRNLTVNILLFLSGCLTAVFIFLL